MSYHVYTTDGIVIKRTPFGEANVLLHILTSDLGLIVASARSVRLSVSKLRPSLQEGSCVSVSCVRGKGGWKITNVASKESFFFSYPEHTHKIVYRVYSILLKMIMGEVPDKKLYLIVNNGLIQLKSLDKEYMQNFEVLIILRILNQLGYVGSNSSIEKYLVDKDDWGIDTLKQINLERISMVEVINKALKESQL